MKMKPTQMKSLANCSPLMYCWAKELASQFILQFVSQSQSNVYVGVTVKFCKLTINLKDPGIVPLFLCFLHSEGIVTKHRMDHLDPKVSVVSSATSKYFAPSDCSGTTEYMRKLIRATPSYRKKFPHYDMVFVRMGLAQLHLDLTASWWHSFASFSPSRSMTLVASLPLLSGFPMLAIHLMKTRECGWFRERRNVMAHLS
jgi:hypothetical protein